MEDNNKLVVTAIIIISISILVVGGFFIYDKLFDKPTNTGNNKSTTTLVNSTEDEIEFLYLAPKMVDENKIKDLINPNAEWMEYKLSSRSFFKYVEVLLTLSTGFDNFNKYFTTHTYDDELNKEICGPKLFTFSMNDKTLTYKYKSGYTQTIENVKLFKYHFNDNKDHIGISTSFDLFVITENNELWYGKFNGDKCDLKEDEIPKFEKDERKIADVKYDLYGNYIYVAEGFVYYYQDGTKIDDETVIGDKRLSIDVNINGEVYLNKNKTDVICKKIIFLEENDYKAFDLNDYKAYFLIDEDNYIYTWNESNLIKYPSKISKLEYLSDDIGQERFMKITFENGKVYYIIIESEYGNIIIN